MCAKIEDYSSPLSMDKQLLERINWRTSSLSSSSSSSSSLSAVASSWLERKIFSHFKRIFRRNSSDSSNSSRHPSFSITEDILSSPIDEQPMEIEDLPLLIPSIDLLYDYDRLLARCFERQEHDRNELIIRSQSPITIPHAVLSVHRKVTILLNWKSYLRLFQNLSRDAHLFQVFINQTYSCRTLINSREQLTLDIQTSQKTFDNLLRKFLDEYVTCLVCQTAHTHLIKSRGRWTIECQLCGSQRTVQRLKWK